MKHISIKSFNQDHGLLAIGSYPAKGTTHTGGGLASYTKNTLVAIKKADPNQKIVVLANVIDQPETYLENGILVIRCWQRNQLSLFPILIQQILRFHQIKNILFEFEFAAYGEIASTSLTIPFLGLLRLLGKRLTSVIHQAVPNLKSLSLHAGLSHKPQMIDLFNKLLKTFYIAFISLSNSIITLEKPLADALNQICPTTKITTIPHGFYPQRPINQLAAKKRLNLNPADYHILSFGYLSYYKGSDIAVEAFEKPFLVHGKNVRLILAGGESPTQGQKPHYQGFYQKLYQLIDNKDNIIHTGFVPDSRIATYFSAADLVIFPYRTLMSASGPLSLAIAYNKPFVVSTPLKLYSPYCFTPQVGDLRKSIVNALKGRKIQKQLNRVTAQLKKERNFNLQGKVYLDIIRSQSSNAKLALWPKTSPISDTAPSFARS